MRPRLALVSLLPLPLLLAACAPGRRPASYLPIGAPGQYGDRTADGLVLLLPVPEPVVRAAVRRAFIATGYARASPDAERRVLETIARPLGPDTTLVVRAEVTPEDPAGGGVVVVISGAYGARALGGRRARAVERPGEQHPLYARLRAVADGTRRFAPSGALTRSAAGPSGVPLPMMPSGA